MIIDSHSHYTQAPPELRAYRGTQLWGRFRPTKGSLKISDDQLVQSLQRNLGQMDELGIDQLIFSPNAGWMGHDFGNELISRYWTEVNNDLIHRVCALYPGRFVPAGMLPQSPGLSPAGCLEELERIADLGFVGVNINPDVSGGSEPLTPGLGEEWWYPLWEKLAELDMPGLIHVSQSQNPHLHTLGAHYINGDTAAVVALCRSRVFEDFPTLKLVVPHGGGAVPFQWPRYRAIHEMEGLPPFEDVVKNLYFDSVLFDQTAVELLITRMGADNVLFATEMFGCGKAVDPQTGETFDRHLVDFVKDIEWLSDEDKAKVLGGNARKLYSRAKWVEPTSADSPTTPLERG